jgi:hypothetical protein
LAKRAHDQGLQYLIVYMIGHVLTDQNREIYLVGADADSKSLQVDDSADEPPPAGARFAAGALGDLLKFDQELKQATSPPRQRPGLVSFRELHAALAEADVPFALLLDGCMPNRQFERFVTSLGLQYSPSSTQLYYIGESNSPHREMSKLGFELTHFADGAPYLKGGNPVVLAAKPGTLAVAKSNPYWTGGAPLGPLASKIDRVASVAATGPAQLSLEELLRRFADFTGVGEIGLDGTISWSDFDKFEDQVVRRRQSSPADKAAFTRVLSPEVGDIVDLAITSDGQFLIAANFWDLWTWQNGTAAKKIRDEVRFPSVVPLGDRDLLLHEEGPHELYRRSTDGRLTLLRDKFYLRTIVPGTKGSVLCAVQSSSIGEKSPILRFDGAVFTEVDRMDTSDLLGLAESEQGDLYFTLDGSSVLHRRRKGRQEELVRGLDRPGALLAAPGLIYALQLKQEKLYRLDQEGMLFQASLQGLDPMRVSETARGVAINLANNTLLLARGHAIVEIDPAKLSWKRITAP